ncbi:hypothetical protein JTB14_037883 [Gonioctena quinquepunctata]|nr:hypothetical protein JTB14_037883 [Gonioctena quinquepunctata]
MSGDVIRKRAPNFSTSEKTVLLNTYKSIIECKKTDGTTWRQKDEAWNKICAVFNSNCLFVMRETVDKWTPPKSPIQDRWLPVAHNRKNIKIIDFSPSTVTDRPQLEEIDPTAVAADNNISIDLEPDCSEKENIAPQGDSSVNESSQTGHKKFIDPTEFRPPFKAKPRKNIRKNRKRGRSMIATDTPEKEQIEKEEQAKKRPMETKLLCANKEGKGVRKV